MGISSLRRCGFAMMMMAMAHTALAATPQEVSGHFLDVPALLEKRADTSSSPLLANIQAPHLETQLSSAGYRVNSAMLLNTRGEPGGFIVVVNRDDGAFTALVNTTARSGLVVGKADGTQTFQEEAKPDREDDYLVEPQFPAENAARAGGSPTRADTNQNVILTVLTGFSEASAQRVGDPAAFALAQIETLNMALRNTGLSHIRLVLSGVSITPLDYEMNQANLDLVPTLFPNHAKADLIASFVGTWNGLNGLAYRNGRTSMTHVATTSTFAHEIGHNIGGAHCPEGNGYNYGYFTGEYSSLLCRKGSWFLSYSNPAKRAPDGVPLGDPETADMARVWRENAPGKSSGEGNDMTRPVLLNSVAAPLECVDVLDGNMTIGAKVGLWKCDKNNPNQRWNKLYFNEKIQFWLAASPKLCLDDDAISENTRAVVLSENSCQYIGWTEEGKGLQIRGNGADLYLHRSSDNQLGVRIRSPGDTSPNFHWQVLDASGLAPTP